MPFLGTKYYKGNAKLLMASGDIAVRVEHGGKARLCVCMCVCVCDAVCGHREGAKKAAKTVRTKRNEV